MFQTFESSQESPLPPPAKKRKTEWPVLLINGVRHNTEFESDTWKCPLCSWVTGRMKQHLLAKHQDVIQDWRVVEQYCKEVSVLKRKKFDAKRAGKPERKEILKTSQNFGFHWRLRDCTEEIFTGNSVKH